MSQLTFDFPKSDQQFDEQNFVFSAENEKAATFLQNFLAQKSFLQNQYPSFILSGSKGCGKTSLLNIFAKNKAKFFDEKKLRDVNFAEIFHENNFYVFEDIDKLQDEELLFRLINSAFKARSFLILSAVSLERFTIRDLISRIQNMPNIAILDPQKSLVKILLAKGFANRQLKIDNDVLDLLFLQLKPNYEIIEESLNLIEKYCGNKKKFSVNDAKNFLMSK